MRSRLLLLAVLFLTFSAMSCKKKDAKSGAVADTPPPPAANGNNGKKGGDKSDSKGRLQNPSSSNEVDPGGLPGKPGWGFPMQEGNLEVPAKPASNNPGPTGQGSGPTCPPPKNPASPPPGGSGVDNPGGKPVSENDMNDIWLFIDARSTAGGEMPGPQDIYAALSAAKSPAADLARNGSIVLTGTRTRESVWAYEAKATRQGGYAVTQNGVQRVSATELNRLLSGK
jgi:hypothetical protein